MNATPPMSIGALAKATGVPVETLRTWERRYGFPEPIRLPSGHRRYPSSVVAKLQLMARAKVKGVQPAESSQLHEGELRLLVDDKQPGSFPDVVGEWPLAEWMTRLRAMDGAGFDAQIMREWARLGVISLLEDVLDPLLRAVGDAWADGSISVVEEHWASERIRDSLAAQWRPMTARNRGPVVVCATLPGEQHDLGLHMVATVVAARGGQVVFLGANSPLPGIAATAASQDAVAVCVSVSASTPPAQSAPLVEVLRGLLPDSIDLLLGGSGAVDVPGALRMGSWAELIDYLVLR